MNRRKTGKARPQRAVRLELTPYGFNFGPLLIERMWSDHGHVAVQIRTADRKRSVIVQASPSGRRLHVLLQGTQPIEEHEP